MERFAILFGVLLCGLGAIGYLSPASFGEVGPKKNPPTALIPAGFGVALLICGMIVSARPAARKTGMHIAAAIAVLGAIGGFVPIVRGEMDFGKASVVTGLLMVVLCGLFVILCVRSFVRARLAQSEGLPEPPPTR
jgi:peptidoglycan/LPS O-acetylase OafA/YrhL